MNHKRSLSIRRKLMVLAILAVLATPTLHAQGNRVVLSANNLSLSEAFRQIEAQTGMNVAVNLSKTDVSKMVHVSKKEGTPQEILDQLLAGTGHTYVTNDRSILIIPPKDDSVPVAQPARPRNAAPAFVPEGGGDPDFERAVRMHMERNPPREILVPSNAPPIVRTEEVTTIVAPDPDGTYLYPSQERPVTFAADRFSSVPYRTSLRKFTVKTNLLWAATLTPNLGVEIGLGRKTTLELMGGYNPWNLDGSFEDNKKLVHTVIKPEFRYWLCERFNGHFFGVHAFYANYNVSGYDIPLLFEKEYRYEGTAFGAGISYGYYWPWSRHWGLEFNVGAGVALMNYEKYNCEKCSASLGTFEKTYVGPTSAGVKLIYTIK